MAINLQDIHQASIDYVGTSIQCSLENLVADIPNAISPGEGFKFDLRVKNNGNIRIIKVKYHIYVSDPAKAKLIVPGNLLYRFARSGYPVDSPLLAPGSQVTDMYLFPYDADKKSLDPNETDLWPNLRGIANSLGNTTIRFNVLGQIDLNYLFPENTMSQQTSLGIQVV